MHLSWKLKLQLAAITVLAVTMAGMSSAVHASGSQQWNKLKEDTRQACLAKSGFKQAKVLEGPVIFSNRVLYRIGGIWPQKHMRGAAGKVYCLHPYPDGQPEIME